MQYVGETFLYPVVDGRSIAGPSTTFQYFFPCDGSTVPVGAASPQACAPTSPFGPGQSLPSLATLLAGDPSRCDATFTLPDIPSPAPGVRWFISNIGAFPSSIDPATTDYPLVGEISIFPDGRPLDPSEGVPCDGRLYPAEELPELFSVIGTTFGGEDDGGNGAFFAVPDLPSPAPSLHYIICTAGAVPQLVPTT